MDDILPIKLYFVQILLIDKRARYNRVNEYYLDTALSRESNLLSAEIDALEKEEERIKKLLEPKKINQ
jgi:hypothetical protein